ncbi:MAG: PQQ-binding-like beta-propeller repeat protein [Acidobacteriota bacterium]
MTRALRRLVAICLTATFAASGAWASTKERWGQFRGPVAEGLEKASALPSSEYGLAVAWSRDLGSGYSNVSIADDKAIATFTSGDVDVVAALDLASGDEVWRYELGEKYAGHDGSTDGPLSTPTIAGDSVYVLGGNGELVALSLADGAEKWRREFNEGNSTVPFYGYTSSPVVSGDEVILATGGEGHSICAFDAKTGKVRWTTGDDSVTYQTPMLLELGGDSVLVAATDQYLQALDPKSGKMLWQHRHTEGEQREGSAQVTPVDDERFLVKYQRGAKLYRAKDGGVEEVWETNAFGNTFAIPVRVDNHFYGFTGRFLTAVDLETGEIAWRSRPPGGLGLAVVDDTLAVAAPNGDLVLVDPSPEGYQEVARIAALDRGDYAFPSFAGDTFVLRNLQQIAAVRIDRSAAPQIAEVNPEDRLKGAFGQWIAALEALPEGQRQAEVDKRSTEVEATPLHDEGGLVHFVWRGEADDVGLAGDPVNQQEVGLHHVEGTDLFFASLELDPKAQYTYTFTVDFGNPTADPTNPHSVDNGGFSVSELRMPEWPASAHLEEPAEDAPRGTLDTFQFRSEILDNTREVQVWRPAGYGQDAEARYPVLVLNHGDNLLRGGLMQNTLDNLVGKSVAPLIAVFVPRSAAPEYGGPQADDYNRFLVEELLPHVDRHYRTDGEQRAIMGPGSAGVAAVYAALSHPEVFSKAATQSLYPIAPVDEKLPEMMASAKTKPEHIYVVWSRHDYSFDPARRADEANQALVKRLEEAGIAYTEHVADYSPGWGGWRGQDDEILAALFPQQAKSN